jgi:hypothetical protein
LIFTKFLLIFPFSTGSAGESLSRNMALVRFPCYGYDTPSRAIYGIIELALNKARSAASQLG